MPKPYIPTPDSKKIKLALGHAVAGETRMVPVGDIHVLENLNLRVKGTAEYDQAVSDFAASIEANGFYPDKPLAGYVDADDKVIVVDGHRRLEAVQRLNSQSLDGDVVTAVPVVLKSEDSTLADLTVSMIQSSSGKDLTMFEKGIGVRRLMSDGMDKDEIARRLGVTTKSIDNYLLVASVPAKARDLLLDNKVTSTHVLRTKGDVGKLTAMVDKATKAGRAKAREGDLTRDETAPKPAPAPQEMAKALAEAISFSVEIVKDAEMGALMRQVAAEIRKVVPHSQGDDDAASVAGTVTVSISLTQPEGAKRARKAKPAPVAEDAGEAPAPQPAAEAPVPAELAHAIPDEL